MKINLQSAPRASAFPAWKCAALSLEEPESECIDASLIFWASGETNTDVGRRLPLPKDEPLILPCSGPIINEIYLH